MSKEKSCSTCGFFSELKEPFERSDGVVIYGYCFKDGDKDYSPNMGKGYPVFADGGGGACKQYKRRRAVIRQQIGKERNVLTNGDRIRSMSDEELADGFAEKSCPPGKGIITCESMGTCQCKECWLQYLRQPAEEAT